MMSVYRNYNKDILSNLLQYIHNILVNYSVY